MKPLKTGIAIGPCIWDIFLGVVAPEDVESILCPLDFSRAGKADAFIAECRANEWKKDPDRAESILRQLIAEGKIQKYNLDKNGCPQLPVGYWAASEQEIRWKRTSY